MRSYGWTTAGEIVADEAEVVRQVAAQLDDGEPLRAVARQLNDRGEVTVQGKTWAPLTVKRMVTSPRMVGDIDGYPPILDREQWERIRTVLTSPERARFTQKGGRSWISGLVRCGRCGGAMYAQSGLDLKCAGAPPDGGEPCRKTTIRREAVETDCESRIVARLSDKKARRALAKLDRETIRARIDDAERRSQVLAAEYGAGVLSAEAFTTGARAARDTITATAGRLRQAELGVELATVDEVVSWWESLPTDRRREVVEILLADVVVTPKAPGVTDRISYTWK